MSGYIIIDAHVHLWEKQEGYVNKLPVYGLGNGKSSFIGETRQMMPPYMVDNRNTAEMLIANMDYAGVNACAVTQEYLDGNQDEYLLKVRAKYPERFRITALYEDEGYVQDQSRLQEQNQEQKLEQKRIELLGNTSVSGAEFFENIIFEKKNLRTEKAILANESGILENAQGYGNGLDSDKSNKAKSRFLGRYNLKKYDGIKICACRLKNRDLTAMMDVFKDVEKAGKYISIDMADGAEQTDSLQKVIDKCPDLRIAIGHFGMVTTRGWQKQIELAKNKNVYIESGGLTWLFHKEFYPYPSAIDAILEAKSICGMDKLMWGSDYPRTMTDITYKSAVRFILETTKLSADDKRKFLGENAVRFYGFEGLKPLPEIDNML